MDVMAAREQQLHCHRLKTAPKRRRRSPQWFATVTRLATLVSFAMGWNTSVAQAPLSLDVSFGCNFNTWYVSSILPMEDGKVILSGQIKDWR